MSDDTTSKWKLELDVKDAADALSHLNEKKDKLGDVESFKDLLSSFKEMGLILGSVALVIFSIKEAMDIVFEAENIKSINAQFELLSENAGIAGEKLKESLVEASNGLVPEIDLLKVANKAMVEMGGKAEHLGEVLDVARQATAVFGGELVDNFEGINNAIATGNTRLLRHMGIIIDQQKAYKDYAKSIGVTADELSKAGQQQAIMNAVLAKGKTAFEGVDPDIKEAQNSWKQFKVALTEMGEAFILLFDKIVGPTIRAALSSLKEFATALNTTVKANFGEGREQAEAAFKQIEGRIESTKKRLEELNQRKLKLGFDTAAGETAALESNLKKLQAQYEQAKVKVKEFHDEAGAEGKKKGGGDEDNIDQKKKLANQAKFQGELFQLKEKALQDSLKLMNSEAQAEAAHEQQKALLVQQYDVERQKISTNESLNGQQKAALTEQLERNLVNHLKTMDEDLKKQRIQSLDQYLKQSQGAAQGVSRAWEVGAKKAAAEVKDFSKLGQQSFDAFNKNAQDGLMSLGEGSKNAGDAMKGFMFGALADIAQSQGALLMASGILNPLALVAGGALLVLAGFLRSQAKGSGGASAPVSSGGGGEGNSSSYGFGTRTDESPSVGSYGPSNMDMAPRHSTSITVQGSLYNSEQTKTALLDIIRQGTDSTDFHYTQVGSGGP